MTLAIHLVRSAIWRSWVARVLKMIVAVLLQLLNTTRRSLVLGRHLGVGLITDRGQLNRATSLVTSRRSTFRGLTLGSNSSSVTLFLGLAGVLFLLLAGLPLLSDLLEFCGRYALAWFALHKHSRNLGRPMLAPDSMRLSPVQVCSSSTPKKIIPRIVDFAQRYRTICKRN